MSECDHDFQEHVGIKVFNNTGMAWIQWELLEPTVLPPEGEDARPRMQVCTKCGEQGYEVPA